MRIIRRAARTFDLLILAPFLHRSRYRLPPFFSAEKLRDGIRCLMWKVRKQLAPLSTPKGISLLALPPKSLAEDHLGEPQTPPRVPDNASRLPSA